MSVIVEGCDGAGKTTLIQKLQYDFPQLELHPRFATSKEGPLDNLATLVYEDEAEMASRRWLYDRHPVISEYIYGLHLPTRKVNPEFLTYDFYRIVRMIESSAFVIFCHPPFDVVKMNVEHEEQMPGVVEHLEELYDAYAAQRITWAGYYSATYDYTDPKSYRMIYQLMRVYLNNEEL